MSSPPPEDAVCITARVMWVPPTVDTTGNPRKRKFSDAQEVVSFMVFAHPNDSLAVVWRKAEREFAKAYGGEKVDLRYFSYMKVATADVFPYHKVSNYFKNGAPPGENILFFVQSDKDRESSIPVHSSLRPSWFTPPALSTPLKRRKVHGAVHGMTVDQIDPDRPVESNERIDDRANDNDEDHVDQPRVDADGFAVPAFPANRKILPAKSRRTVKTSDASQATILVQDSQATESQVNPQLATHQLWLKKQGAGRQHSAPLIHSSPTESAAARAKTTAPQPLQLNQPKNTPLAVSEDRRHESNARKGHKSIPTPPSVEDRLSDPHEAPTSAQRHSSRTPQFEDARTYFRRTSHSNPITGDPIVDDEDFLNGIDDDEILNDVDNLINAAEDGDYVPPGGVGHRGRTRSQSVETIPPHHFIIDRRNKSSSQLLAVSPLPLASDVPSSDQPSTTNAFDALLSSQGSGGTQRKPEWSQEEDIALLKGFKKNMTVPAIIKAFKLNRTTSSCRNRKRDLLKKFPNLKIPPDHEYYALVQNASVPAPATPSAATSIPATAPTGTADIAIPSMANPVTVAPKTSVPIRSPPATSAPVTTAPVTTRVAMTDPASNAIVNALLIKAAVISDPVTQDDQQADSPLAIPTPRETSAAPEARSQLKKEPGNDQSKLGFKHDRKKGVDGPSRATIRAQANEQYGHQRPTSCRARLQERYNSTHVGAEDQDAELPEEEDYVMSGALGVSEGREDAGEGQTEPPNQASPEAAEEDQEEQPTQPSPEAAEGYLEQPPTQPSHGISVQEPNSEAPMSPAKSEQSLTDSDRAALRDIDHSEEDEPNMDPAAGAQQPSGDVVKEAASSRPSTSGSGPSNQLSQELQQSAEATPEQSLEATPLPETMATPTTNVAELPDLRTWLKKPTADGFVLIGRPERPVVFAVDVIESDENLLKDAKNTRKTQKHLAPLQFELNRLSVQSYIAMCAGDMEAMAILDTTLKPRQVFLELIDRGKIDEHDDYDKWLEQFDDDVNWNEEWEALENNPPSDFFEDCDDGYGALAAKDSNDLDSVSHRGEVEEILSEDEGEDEAKGKVEGQADLNMQKRVEATAQEEVEVENEVNEQAEIGVPNGAEDKPGVYEAPTHPEEEKTETTESEQLQPTAGMTTCTPTVSTESKAERKRRKKQEKAERRAAQGKEARQKAKRKRNNTRPTSTDGQ